MHAQAHASYNAAGAGSCYAASDDYSYDPLSRLSSLKGTNDAGERAAGNFPRGLARLEFAPAWDYYLRCNAA